VWTIGDVLRWTASHFAEKGIDSARLDAELLLAHALQVNRLHLYTHYDQPLSASEREAYRALVQRRARREPVAYILGEREFYGHRIEVTRDVLIPRPETEHLVDFVIGWLRAHEVAAPQIADLCTGSGAVAIALGLAIKDATLFACDISAAALEVAKKNLAASSLTARCTLLVGDLCAPLLAWGALRLDVVVANPPYVAEKERATLAPEVLAFEPGLALFAGQDGLLAIERLCAQAWQILRPGGLLAFEIGSSQKDAVEGLVHRDPHYRGAQLRNDLAGRPRVALVERA
jgi:release factor glutamine methyltransferase